MSERISIIIPTYQHGQELSACLESIFSQTQPIFEIIVVDDGSSDNTGEVLAAYKDRITSIRQENKGANAARNRGFYASSGEYLLFCDADIVLERQALAKMLAVLHANPGASYAYSSFQFGFKTFTLWEFNANKLKQMPYIHTTSLIRRDHFFEFDESIKRLQDWDLWLTMLERGFTGVWVPEVLFFVKARKNGMSEWMPSLMYNMPWPILGFTPKAIIKYREAERIIRQKHHLL